MMVKCTNILIREDNMFRIHFFFAYIFSFSSDNLRPTVQTQVVLRNVRTTRTDWFPFGCFLWKLLNLNQASRLITICAVTNYV